MEDINTSATNDLASVATSTGTLSRTTVYATLQSYNNNDVRLPKKLPKNVQDNALLSFYANVSTQYHRSVPFIDGKNTAARPLSTADITTRMSQRAITFVNHYNSGTKIKAKKKKKCEKKQSLELVTSSSFNVSASQNKRKRQNLAQRVNNRIDSNCDPLVNDVNTTIAVQQQLDLQFVVQLNNEWNQYIRNLLQLDDINLPTNELVDTEKIIRNVEKRISSLQDNHLIEWVGAYVRFMNTTGSTSNSNNNNNNSTGDDVQSQQKKVKVKTKSMTKATPIEGILISHTPNHWMIVPIASDDDGLHTTGDSTAKVTRTNDNDNTNEQQGRRMVTLLPAVKIPKYQQPSKQNDITMAVVTVRIPISTTSGSCIDIHNTNSNEEVQFMNIHLQTPRHRMT